MDRLQCPEAERTFDRSGLKLPVAAANHRATRRTKEPIMKITALIATSASLLTPIALNAAPLSPVIEHQLQCFLSISTLIPSTDEKTKRMGVLGSMFFAGEAFGADPKIDMTAALKQEAAKLDDARVKELLPKCGAEMNARGEQINAAGRALQSNAKAK
jgi:hypothetical protein